jgi:hypothetical protein
LTQEVTYRDEKSASAIAGENVYVVWWTDKGTQKLKLCDYCVKSVFSFLKKLFSKVTTTSTNSLGARQRRYFKK